MPEDLIDRLRAGDPAAEPDPEAAARDAAVWARISAAALPPKPDRRRPRTLIAIATGLAVVLALMALGVGRDRKPGGDFDAAARTYAALRPANVLYHFRTESRLTESPAGIARGRTGGPFLFPLVATLRVGQPSYDEVWLTPGGRQRRWVHYRSASGGVSRAYAVAQFRPMVPVKGLPPRLRHRLEAQACSRVQQQQIPSGLPRRVQVGIGPASDPASGFVTAYCTGAIVSKGEATLDGRPVWRFVNKPSEHGLRQEWLVDRHTWLPVRYRYVDHNQNAGRAYTARLTVRFLEFEVLPLNAQSRSLLHLTPEERAACEAAKQRDLDRARAYLSPRRYRLAERVMRRVKNCR